MHLVPAGRISSVFSSYQASLPFSRNSRETASIASLSIKGSPHSLQKKIGIGTPHFL